jgi:hypothetical protein
MREFNLSDFEFWSFRGSVDGLWSTAESPESITTARRENAWAVVMDSGFAAKSAKADLAAPRNDPI